MSSPDADAVFTGSIPDLYETHLVPMIFQPYATDLAHRLAAHAPTRVLEIAAGTGVLTRALAAALPAQVPIVATDLNPAMLDRAMALPLPRPVEWRQADAMHLPFAAESFDAVVCQFGAMFFPDKAVAFSEARRVLRSGGVFMFNVWDRLAENEFADAVGVALVALFPDDPPRFMARIPHGYYEQAVIERDLSSSGFSASPQVVTVTERSRAVSADVAALAYCQGTPLRNELEARAPSRLGEITHAVADALSQRFGRGPLDGKIQAHVVAVQR